MAYGAYNLSRGGMLRWYAGGCIRLHLGAIWAGGGVGGGGGGDGGGGTRGYEEYLSVSISIYISRSVSMSQSVSKPMFMSASGSRCYSPYLYI